VQSAEFRDTPTNRLIVALPARIGCRNIEGSNRLVFPVGNNNAASLIVVFSDAEVIASANTVTPITLPARRVIADKETKRQVGISAK